MEHETEFRRLVGRLRMRHLALLHLLGLDPNVGRCAARMHMAQPTASKLLREIEDIFQAALFTRNRRGLTPTPIGMVLTRRAGMMLAEMQATHAELNAARQGATGRLRLGVFPVAAQDLLPQLYAHLQEQWPGLNISIEEGVEITLLQALSDGRIDAIVGRVVMENLTSDLRHEALYMEPTTIVCNNKHPILKARPKARLEILRQASWILPANEGAVHNMVASRLASLGIYAAPQVTVETTSVFATLQLLRHTHLLAILPHNVAKTYRASGHIGIVPVEALESTYPIGVIYRMDSGQSPLIQCVLQAARQSAVSGLAQQTPLSRRRALGS